MPKRIVDEKDETVSLITKMLVFQLFNMGANQRKIAKIVGKKKAWVNDLLKGIQKGGKSDDDKKKSKKGKGRTNN